MKWKPLALLVWSGGIKLALTEFAKQTDNKWDDKAIEMLDAVILQVLS